MAYPTEATSAHRNGREFYLTDEQVEVALKDSLKLPNRDFVIPTNRFGEEEVTSYAFGDSARNYGNFLKDAGIKEMPVWMVDNIGDKSFVRQAWLGRLGSSSGLGGGDGGLSYGDWVRGVREDALASEQGKTDRDDSLDKIVKNALRQKTAFEYGEIIYVPVLNNSVSLKK